MIHLSVRHPLFPNLQYVHIQLNQQYSVKLEQGNKGLDDDEHDGEGEEDSDMGTNSSGDFVVRDSFPAAISALGC